MAVYSASGLATALNGREPLSDVVLAGISQQGECRLASQGCGDGCIFEKSVCHTSTDGATGNQEGEHTPPLPLRLLSAHLTFLPLATARTCTYKRACVYARNAYARTHTYVHELHAHMLPLSLFPHP